MDFLRRLFGRPPDCYRSTLTLLPDDRIVVGLPDDATQEMAVAVSNDIRRWLDGRPDGSRAPTLILPFPVDVVDLRSR